VLSTDIFGKRELVKVISMGAIITSIASVISNTLVGSLVETISYRPMFIVMGFAYAFAFLIVYLLLREPKSKDSSAD
jgi:ACS family hexuronate transporter-like MFS transporter